MNIKFCYRDEIHKTFFPPPNFKSLLEEIKASFGDRLPPNFVLQYKDKDGDLITMSSDLEYSSMLRFDTPVTVTSVKVFIVPSEKLVEEKDASFEVIEASQSFSDACLSEFSLGSKTHSQGCRTPSNNISPLRAPLKSSDRLKSLTFSEGEKDEQGSEEFTSPMFKTSVDFNTESFNQLYQTRAMIVQECMEDKPPSTQDKAVQKTETVGLEEQRPMAPNELDRLESSIVLKEIDKFMNELAVKRVQTQSFTEATKEDAANKVPPYVATAAIQKVYLDYGADRASSYVPVEVQRALGSSVSESFVQEVRNEYRYDAYGSTSEANQLMTSDKYSVSREVEYGDHHLQGSSAQYEPSYKLSASYQDCYSSQNGLDSSNRSEIYTPTAYKPDEIRPFQMYSYQLMAGMSSSLLFMTKDGQGIAYKTIYLKNTGMKPWKKCYVKPINNTQGKTMEIFNIDITDIALVTLELTGYFNVGIYNSEWKIIHENENGVVETIGEPFNVDFIIEASNIMTTKGDIASPKFESYSLSMTEEKTKSFLDETFQKETDEEETDGTEEEEDTSLSVSANEEKVQYTYEAAGTYSKEYLEYREKITNKAKEIKKIFPEDTPDEIVRFVMQRPELNFEDLLVAYLEMKDGR